MNIVKKQVLYEVYITLGKYAEDPILNKSSKRIVNQINQLIYDEVCGHVWDKINGKVNM